MTKQVLYNLEITRGDNRDYLEWAFKANSFYDAALVLAATLEAPIQQKVFINSVEYEFENGRQSPVSFYPAFFYVSAHSIELMLKAIAMQSGIPIEIIIKYSHNLQKLINEIKKTSFPFPTLTGGEETIVNNMGKVLSTGAVKYPNAKNNGTKIYEDIKSSILSESDEFITVSKKSGSSNPFVGEVVAVDDNHYNVKVIKAIEEASLNISTYNQLWQKISKSLDLVVIRELHSKK